MLHTVRRLAHVLLRIPLLLSVAMFTLFVVGAFTFAKALGIYYWFGIEIPPDFGRWLKDAYLPIVIVLMMLVITLAGTWWGTRRSRADGFCAACGYDLRATPDRCPECGTVPPPSA
jgi:hypothetical protein